MTSYSLIGMPKVSGELNMCVYIIVSCMIANGVMGQV